MTYSVTHTTGEMERDFPVTRFPELLDELESADAEHADVALTHESEWSLSAYRSGVVVLENLEDDEPMHAVALRRDEILELFHDLAVGEIDKLLARKWLRGYPSIL